MRSITLVPYLCPGHDVRRVLAAAAVGILAALPYCAIGLFFGVPSQAERSLRSPFWSPSLWFFPCSQSAASLRRAEEGTQESRAVVSAPAGDPI